MELSCLSIFLQIRFAPLSLYSPPRPFKIVIYNNASIGPIAQNQAIFNCGRGNYCCRATNTFLTCCLDISALFFLGNYENITIGGASGPGYQSTTMLPSSSPTQISSTTTTTTTPESIADNTSSSPASTVSSSTVSSTSTSITSPASTSTIGTTGTTTSLSATTSLAVSEASAHSNSLSPGVSAGIGIGVAIAVIFAAVGAYFFYNYAKASKAATAPDQIQMLPQKEYYKPELSAMIPEYARDPYQHQSAEMDGNRSPKILELPASRLR